MSHFKFAIRPKPAKLKIKIDLPYGTMICWACWATLALVALTLSGDAPR